MQIMVKDRLKRWLGALLFFAVVAFGHNQRLQAETNGLPANLRGVKCVVSGKQVTPAQYTAYKSGIVYFDCNDSRLKFHRQRKSYATKANHQLLVTAQYAQSCCPLSETIVTSENPAIQLMGVKIHLGNRWLVDQLKTNRSVRQQAKTLFADKVFDRAFVPISTGKLAATANRAARNR